MGLGGLSLGMAEFMMMGVLPDVAGSLGITIPSAGHLITAYALGVVIGAPLMVALTRRFSPKTILIGLMVMFAIFNGLFALAPVFELLLITRLLAGLPHGAFFGVGAVVASQLAEPGKKAQAVSLMFAGLTVANLIGVPLGTYIGHTISWRLSFFIVAAVALITAWSIKKWLPDVSQERTEHHTQSNVFANGKFWLIIAISTIGSGGLFAWISYIAPFMTDVARFETDSISFIMITAGLGMAVGNLIGGKLADRFSPLMTTSCLLLAMVISLVAVALVSQSQIAAIIMTFVTGAIAFAVIAPIQMLMINTAKGSEMLASSSIQASANMANALGAFLGGLPIAAGYGFTSPMYIGAGLAFTGFLITVVMAAQEAYRTKQFDQGLIRPYNSINGL